MQVNKTILSKLKSQLMVSFIAVLNLACARNTEVLTATLYKIVSAFFLKTPTVPVQQTSKKPQQLYQIPGTNQLISLPGKQLEIRFFIVDSVSDEAEICKYYHMTSYEQHLYIGFEFNDKLSPLSYFTFVHPHLQISCIWICIEVYK